MLNLTTAAALLKSIQEYFHYDMLLIDVDGVIMAAPDPKRRAKVHNLALELLGSVDEYILVEPEDANNLRGFECGIYLTLYAQQMKAGVLAVLGAEKAQLPIVNIVKICIEEALELELARHASPKSNEQYLQRLMYNTNLSKEDIDHLVRIMHIQPDILRVPILFVVHNVVDGVATTRYNVDILRNQVLTSEFYGSKDLLSRTLDNNVIWFKALEHQKQHSFISDQEILNEQIEELMKPLGDIVFSAYIGPIQNKLCNYSTAYRQCEWMRVETCKTGIYYFHDYLFRYMSNKLSKDEYDTIFSAMRSEIDTLSASNFCEMMGALIACDYNFSRTAERLFIHKNTALYRFDKIRNLTGMNPLTNASERMYLEVLYNYYKAYPDIPLE